MANRKDEDSVMGVRVKYGGRCRRMMIEIYRGGREGSIS